uniref:Nucleic acid binding protein n=1 Tax=Solanum tuberosum TaxID=4113 RepID=M0ZRK8_SOLTU
MFFLSTDLGIEKSIFIKPKTFHLTVLMLKLWNKDRIEAAAEVLRVDVCNYMVIFFCCNIIFSV